MRAVVQRVRQASVLVEGRVVGEIGSGLLVFVGVANRDTAAQAEYLAGKVVGLRIFADADGKMNLSVADAAGAVLVVSQFTLYGDVRKGRRPAFDRAAGPAEARALYEYFCQAVARGGVTVRTGVFQAMMQVELVNDGPVTILLDSDKLF